LETIAIEQAMTDPRINMTPTPHVIEVGSRGAEVASYLMDRHPACRTTLVGGWPSPRRHMVLQWFERREWDDRYEMAMRRTEHTPPRRTMHRCDPEDALMYLADYCATSVVFTEVASIGLLNLWWRKVRPGGSMCGIRERETDDIVDGWVQSVKLEGATNWAKRAWCVDKAA
jgi:hypothetical protein